MALERTTSWLRRITPRGEFNSVAMSTLDAVVSEGPQRVSDLAARERISQPGMTGLVTRLAEAGLVERRSDPLDGRVALIAATDTGRAHLRRRRAARAAVLAEHIARLPEERQQALLAAVDALTALPTDPPPDPTPPAPPTEAGVPGSPRPTADRPTGRPAAPKGTPA